ncbi:DUF1269 domain-containing protein [Corynebacterium nuruki]|uniref:DUF1269 domain-containing protein n=1 Tax=Corynebacterium nuruki TaxID=1032851 RepID=UPI0039BF88CB
MTDYVAVATFPDNATTYQAFSALKNSPVSTAVDTGAIVERDEHGNVTVPEGYNADFGAGIGTGSLIGILVGVLGGPLGMLLGWGLGASIGALSDADRADTQSSALLEFSRRVPTGRNALALQTDEADTRALDDFVAHYNGEIVRRPLDEVLAEIETAEQASRQASAAAEEALKLQKKADREQAWDDRKTELRQKRQDRINRIRQAFA